MLTATYSIVTISTEQTRTRRILYRLQQYVRNAWKGLVNIDVPSVETAVGNLTQFDRFCHSRKVEVHVIPTLRRITSEADHLLAELEALSASGMNALRSLRDQLGRTLHEGVLRVNDVSGSMDLYCHRIQQRLAREEEELFPLVRRLFSIEEWFAIAEKFLADDAVRRSRKQVRSAPPLILPSAYGRHVAML
jgi:hemerythrin-like domain-containing protein